MINRIGANQNIGLGINAGAVIGIGANQNVGLGINAGAVIGRAIKTDFPNQSNTIFGYKSDIEKGSYNVIVGPENFIEGNNNIITGNNNLVTGNNNIVFGNNLEIIGNNNIIFGNTMVIIGDDHYIVLSTHIHKNIDIMFDKPLIYKIMIFRDAVIDDVNNDIIRYIVNLI